MTINLDKTYCASPDCVNACGRKFPGNEPLDIKTRIWFAFFCGQPAMKEIEKDRENLLSEIIDAS